MIRSTTLTLLAALALSCGTAAAREDGTYYPYQMYQEYYDRQTPTPPKALPPAPPPPAAAEDDGKEQVPQQAPEFLFPKELGFGVAVGVAYDMFYLDGLFYRVKGARWYRSASWRGPWKPVPAKALPPELTRKKLSGIRELRNREFKVYWEEKGEYRGRVFRPGAAVDGKRPN